MTFLAFFLPAVVGLYFISQSPKWRNGVLVVFSLLFYAWGEPQRIFLMLFSILVNYICAIVISCAESKLQKRIALITGLAVTVGMLIYFKYFAFFANSVAGIFGVKDLVPIQSLPIGISFFTFQIITYTVDVYLGKVKPQRSLARLILYISFFPQLIAGPIVNYTYVSKQLRKRKTSITGIYEGLSRFVIGLSKKVLIANVCGEILGSLTLTDSASVLGAWLGAFAFSLQIYFDFSGYSDMAIGLGRIFGFRFLENFNYPYISTSVTDFWRRWHISLGAFFREYVYIPMGGNRVSAKRHIINLLTVWALTGLWHGASWNFIVWGLYYGLLLVAEKFLLKDFLAKLPKVVTWLGTMLLVMVGWVFFYHESLADGFRQLGAMFFVSASGFADSVSVYYLKRYLGILIAGVLACIPWKQFFGATAEKHPTLNTANPWVARFKAVAIFALVLVSLAFLVSSSYNPFLYFRF
jgi:alginate O-acetyltransferase complex protein AlgI